MREGEDNDKFYQHPRGKWSKRAYQVLHSTVYHVFNLCVCTLLLFLALMEHPYLGEEANLPDNTLVTIIKVSWGGGCVCAGGGVFVCAVGGAVFVLNGYSKLCM